MTDLRRFVLKAAEMLDCAVQNCPDTRLAAELSAIEARLDEIAAKLRRTS